MSTSVDAKASSPASLAGGTGGHGPQSDLVGGRNEQGNGDKKKGKYQLPQRSQKSQRTSKETPAAVDQPIPPGRRRNFQSIEWYNLRGLRFAQLAARVSRVVLKISLRRHFFAWSEEYKVNRSSISRSANQKRAPTPTEASKAATSAQKYASPLAAKAGTSAAGTSGSAEPQLSLASTLTVKRLARRIAAPSRVAEGLPIMVPRAPQTFDHYQPKSQRYTGTEKDPMIGTVSLAYQAYDSMWHVVFKEISKQHRDLGALLAMERWEPPAASTSTFVSNLLVTHLVLILREKETDTWRYKWTFVSSESHDKREEVSTFEALISLSIADNKEALKANKPKRMAENYPPDLNCLTTEELITLFRTQLGSIIKIQRLWRRTKQRSEARKEFLNNQVKEFNRRMHGAIQMQKIVRAAKAKKMLIHRRKERENECLGAIRVGAVDWMVLMITKKGVHVNFQDQDRGWTPLHHAAHANQEAIVEALVNHGALLEMKDAQGNTPLHVACLRRATGAARRLAICGANIEAVNHKGHTPITKPELFLMPLLEGLGRQMSRFGLRSANFYDEPISGLKKQQGLTGDHASRHIHPAMSQTADFDKAAGNAAIAFVMHTSQPRVSGSSPQVVVPARRPSRSSQSQAEHGDAHASRPDAYAHTWAGATARAVVTPLPVASLMPTLSHPAFRKRDKRIAMEHVSSFQGRSIVSPLHVMPASNLARTRELQPMSWTVPMSCRSGSKTTRF